MKKEYKGYLITLEKQAGFWLATALSDTDYFKIKFMGYTKSVMFDRMQIQCVYRESEGY
jgi:hypothetical protein